MIIIKEVSNVNVGAVLGRTIYDSNGNNLLSKGATLTQERLDKIKFQGIDYLYLEEDSSLTIADEKYFYEVKEETVCEVRDIYSEISEDLAFDIESIEEMVMEIFDNILDMEKVVIGLGNLKDLGEYYYKHAIETTVLAIAVSIVLGLRQEIVRDIAIGTLLHDIGSLKLPNSILKKDDKLSDKEFEIVKKHVEYGYELLKSQPEINERILETIKFHHENINGSGYLGLSKTDIPIGAKVCAICDVYTALISNRNYRKKISRYKATEIIAHETGQKFDKYIVKKFLSIVGHYPKDMNVILNNGYHGVIVKQNNFNPVVKLLLTNKGEKVIGEEVINLANSTTEIYEVDPFKDMYDNLIRYTKAN